MRELIERLHWWKIKLHDKGWRFFFTMLLYEHLLLFFASDMADTNMRNIYLWVGGNKQKIVFTHLLTKLSNWQLKMMRNVIFEQQCVALFLNNRNKLRKHPCLICDQMCDGSIQLWSYFNRLFFSSEKISALLQINFGNWSPMMHFENKWRTCYCFLLFAADHERNHFSLYRHSTTYWSNLQRWTEKICCTIFTVSTRALFWVQSHIAITACHLYTHQKTEGTNYIACRKMIYFYFFMLYNFVRIVK